MLSPGQITGVGGDTVKLVSASMIVAQEVAVQPIASVMVTQ
jgi:hypothetical protein